MTPTELLSIANLVAIIGGGIALWNRTNATVHLLENTIKAIDRRLTRIEDRCFATACPHRKEEDEFEHD